MVLYSATPCLATPCHAMPCRAKLKDQSRGCVLIRIITIVNIPVETNIYIYIYIYTYIYIYIYIYERHAPDWSGWGAGGQEYRHAGVRPPLEARVPREFGAVRARATLMRAVDPSTYRYVGSHSVMVCIISFLPLIRTPLMRNRVASAREM